MKSLREYIDIIKEADGVTNPHPAGTPQAAAWDRLSPQMKANIGGADPTDKHIISAMADGSGWGRAKGISDANPDGTPKVAAPVAAPAPAAVATPVAEPAPAAPAQQQAANPTPAPTPPKTPAPSDPKVQALQTKLIALGARIKADGVMGPMTQAAMKQYGLDINGNSTSKNVAPAGTPPATVMKDTPVGQLQTGAAQNAKAASDRSATTTDPNRTSLNANIKVAQPTGPIAPTGINNGSGVGKSYQMTPDEMKAVADNGSDYDKQALSQTPGGAVLMPMRQKTRQQPSVKESTGYDEVDRIVSLVHYR